MPTLDIPVKEFPRHVLVPIVRQYTHKLIKDFNLENVIKDNIFYKYGFSATSKTKDRHKNINLKTNRVDVEVDVNMNPDNLKWDMTNFYFNPGYGFTRDQLAMSREMFIDPDIECAVYLHEVPCNVTLNITFTLLSRTTAFTMQSAHYELHGGENTFYLGDFMYDIPVNNEVLKRLHGIFKMRRFDPKKINFANYLKVGSKNAISLRINRTNTDHEFIFRQNKLQILEDVELSGDKPQENNDNEGTISFSVGFTYTIQFSRPAFYTMMYPITIMNQMVPIQHLPITQEIRDNIRNTQFVESQLEKIAFLYWENVYRGYDHCFVSPFYEDWREPSETWAKGYSQRPFWIITFTLDEDENGNILPETVINLKENIVDKYKFHPIVQEIIGIQGCESYEYDCLYNISIFKNNKAYYFKDPILDWQTDEISAVIKATDRSGRYHIVISEMMDLNYLNPKWYFLVERYGDFLKGRVGNTDLSSFQRDYNGIGDGNYGNYISTRVLYADLIPLKEGYQQADLQ